MFSKSAEFYNTIYLGMDKDYAAEADKVHALIQKHKRTDGKQLLDVACGTGLHLGYLKKWYRVEGLDLDGQMLKVARRKYPTVRFHHADMLDFDLGRQFDAITCLFSSVGYSRTLPRLRRAIRNMAGHLKPGGVMLVEPWFSPKDWRPGHPHAVFMDQPNLKIARMNISGGKGRFSYLTFHYLVATPEGIRYFTERHELGLFTHNEYLGAFREAGLDVVHDKEGLDGRGLYIGRKGRK